MDKTYVAIDLKAFYASVECVERGLDPLDTNLVVADMSRTEKTICLAVSPSLKTLNTGGRPRLFEVVQKVKAANRSRGNGGSSCSKRILDSRRDIQIDYIVAPPRMALYIDYSTRIFEIYMRFVAPEDIHVYSIDEVFIDVTGYRAAYGMSAHDLTMKIVKTVLAETGITATAGIGTNLYLAKVAMDIVAKKMPADSDGVRIAELDEMEYRRRLWHHEPLTDFWRVGRGTVRRLAQYGITTMGDIARMSLEHEDSLYSLFGVNAELLIDHAWGWEPVTIAQVKAYKPDTHSMSSGQVLPEPYTVERARIVVLEMAENIALDLVGKHQVAGFVTLTIGYDVENMTRCDIRCRYNGRVSLDHYGRQVPCHSHGTSRFDTYTSSARIIGRHVADLFDRIANDVLLIRRLTITAGDVRDEASVVSVVADTPVQLSLFSEDTVEEDVTVESLERERRLQETVLSIRNTFGKNALCKGLNFADGATQRSRNKQIGGHKA